MKPNILFFSTKRNRFGLSLVIIIAVLFLAWQFRSTLVRPYRWYVLHSAIPTGQQLAPTNNKIPTLSISVDKEPWKKKDNITGQIRIDGNGVIDDVASFDMTIHVRGNTTSSTAKKPYTFKCKKKVKIGNLDEGKKYVLLANYYDPTLLRTQTSMKMAELLGFDFVNHVQPVNVVVNGDYRGVYDLTEKVDIGRNGFEIDVESGGVLVELTRGTVDKDNSVLLPIGESGINCEILSPTSKDMAIDVMQIKHELMLLHSKVTQLDSSDSIGASEIYQKFDIRSLVDYSMLYNVIGNDEWTKPKSLYLWKFDKFDKFDKWHIGPLWDCDLSFGTLWIGPIPPQTVLTKVNGVGPHLLLPFFTTLMSTSQFKELYAQRWDELKLVLPEIYQYIDRQALVLSEATVANAIMWPIKSLLPQSTKVKKRPDSLQNAQELKDWLEARIEFMDSAPNWGLY